MKQKTKHILYALSLFFALAVFTTDMRALLLYKEYLETATQSIKTLTIIYKLSAYESTLKILQRLSIAFTALFFASYTPLIFDQIKDKGGDKNGIKG